MKLRPLLLSGTVLLASLAIDAFAESPPERAIVAAEQDAQVRSPGAELPELPIDSGADAPETVDDSRTILTLRNLISLENGLRAEIRKLNLRLEKNPPDTERRDLLNQIERLNEDIGITSRNIQEVAAGADISSLRANDQPAFDFQKELFSLLEPVMKEMKDMTSHLRKKTAQRDRIAYYSSKLPTTEHAISSIESLLQQAQDPALQLSLQSMLEAWRKQRTFFESEIQSASLQLRKLEETELSLAESSQSYFKSFFQKRGLYLGRAALVVLVILLLSRLLRRAMEHYIAGYQKAQRSFHIRLLDLAHRVLAGVLVVIGPMVVFYMAEDWLLFSLGVLFLLGMALALRHAVPRYWQLVQLFLNIGTVREGERIEMNGLPWLVQKINFYTLLLNPTVKLTRRVKIDDLVDLRSRAVREPEAWFPCKRGDWLAFDDGNLAKVIGISEEFTEVVLLGGAHKTYTTSAFLACAPTCLSHNFRIKETIGVSYSLQAESVSTLCGELRDHVQKRIEEEGYGKYLLNLSVEFQLANTSSLDIAVIADFDGEIAHAYNRLHRSAQRWCVEACTERGWEIPFMQVTLHQPG